MSLMNLLSFLNRMKYNLIFFILLFTVFNSFAEEEPSWVYLKKAENYKEKRDYAEAIIQARKARKCYIEEKLELYYKFIQKVETDKTAYEQKKMVQEREIELKENDNYPQYHELMGDLYVLSNFLQEAENEYRIALSQKDYFDYEDKWMEIKYKLADVYLYTEKYEMADMVYREIVEGFFDQKNKDYWNRIKYNIRNDETLKHVFRIYRLDGIIYLKALYMIGRRSAILQRKYESLFYLSCATIVWMTYYGDLIKQNQYSFQYTNPVDFINYVTKKNLYQYMSSSDFIIDKIIFFIGYNYQVDGDEEVKEYFFDLAKIFSSGTDHEKTMTDMVEYFKINPEHRLTFNEIAY